MGDAMPVITKALTILLAIAILAGCVGAVPFLQVQVCLDDEKNVREFIDVMRSASRSHGMEYFDRSAASQRELHALNKDPGYPLISISAHDRHGVGWAAGNLGLSAHEVALGFSEGADPATARKFADDISAQLSRKWKLYRVPPDSGALSLAACKGHS